MIPLDAPVVLIHGQNGTGKTSTLSAIELALTGHVESLARLDGNYTTHLVHKMADEARVEVTVEEAAGTSTQAEIAVRGSTVIGKPLLSATRARAYTERCYLAQATVSRLLEMYENKESSRHDSPLTAFVKELLGLGDLEALIEGLHIAGDIRRLRGPVPEYSYVRDAISSLEVELAAKKAEFKGLADEIGALRDRMHNKLEDAGLLPDRAIADEHLARALRGDAEEPALQRLAQLRREIAAIRALWQESDASADLARRATAERAVSDADAALAAWRSSSGPAVGSLFERLSPFFPNLPSPESDPESARQAAITVLGFELQRCVSVLARDADSISRVATLDSSIRKARSRIAALEDQIADHVDEAGALAKALAGIHSHIAGEICPVCSRDFNEVAAGTLDSFVSTRITELTEKAGHLQSLVRNRTDEERGLAMAVRERDALAARQLAVVDREGLSRRQAQLEDIQAALSEISEATKAGGQAINAAAAAARQLLEFQSTDHRNAMISESIDQFSAELALESAAVADTVESKLKCLETDLADREEKLNASHEAKRSAQEDLRERLALEGRHATLQQSIATDEERLSQLKAAKRVADRRILQARKLRSRARTARNSIIARVFNETLNVVWQELFVRLAPDEPFVPAFALPNGQTESVEAVLETLYRTGGRGGNPRAMLSAGNLNTAALTLFLALHFTANPALPWLVIDDPVQSMDEVHVAQLAALLRMLSKQHGRQVIMAVHEKPLFDYLALELSPAFQDDRLVTVELGRNAAGQTWSAYERVTWQPDPAIAA